MSDDISASLRIDKRSQKKSHPKDVKQSPGTLYSDVLQAVTPGTNTSDFMSRVSNSRHQKRQDGAKKKFDH